MAVNKVAVSQFAWKTKDNQYRAHEKERRRNNRAKKLFRFMTGRYVK